MIENDDAQPLFVGLGELIWDMLPDGKRLGGAPTNFAYLARLLGNRSAVASRVGDDSLGREALDRLASTGLNITHIQIDGEHPTGTVGVEIGAGGEPHFRVNENSAWGYLRMEADWEELAASADVICFGTLGQRNQCSRETINRFLQLSRPRALRLFDVNLRHSFFNAEMLSRSLTAATLAKLNEEELSTAARMLGLVERDEVQLCRQIIYRFGLELVAVTKGSRGSLLVSRSEEVMHDGYKVQVSDTIGCGDAFSAALAHCIIRNRSLEETSRAANRLGAWVATCTGATPEINSSLEEQLFGPEPSSLI